MARRKRRASSSSVETVEHGQVSWRRDIDVVKPAENDEEFDEREFELRDVVVLNKDGTTLENALDVRSRGPFIVRGNSVINDLDKKPKWLAPRVRLPVAIEVPHCVRYAFGQCEDENGAYQPVLWLAGHACWFEINPSSEYMPIFRDIATAITMYYTVYDIYLQDNIRLSRTNDPIKKIAPVLHKYAARIGENLTLEEAVARCDKLAGFLLSQCVQSQADAKIDWQDTFFFQWLSDRHPHINDMGKAPQNQATRGVATTSTASDSRKPEKRSSAGLPTRRRTTRSGSATSTMRVTDTTSETQDEIPTRQRSSRSRSAAVNESMASIGLETAKPQTPQRTPQAPVASSPPVEDDSALSSVIKALERVASEMKKSHSIPIATILNKIYAGYSVPGYQKYSGSYKVPIIEIIHFNVHALLDRLDKQRFEGTEFWSWLQELSTKELKLEALKPSDFPFMLTPRKSLNKPRVSLRNPATAQVNKQLEDASEDEPITRPPRTGKGLGKGLKTPQTRKPGKSSLRPSTASRKRFYSQIESDEEDSDAAVKRSHYFSDDDSSMDDSGDLGIHKDEPIKLILRADRIPSATPQSANGTWTCEEEDCDYIVRGGDEKECQERIQQHFKDHEQQIQRVELTLTEGNRGHQSINHLLEKIKKLGGKSQSGTESSADGSLPPQPIKRKLIV